MNEKKEKDSREVVQEGSAIFVKTLGVEIWGRSLKHKGEVSEEILNYYLMDGRINLDIYKFLLSE